MIYSILEKFRNKNHVIWSSYAKDMRETSKKTGWPTRSDRTEPAGQATRTGSIGLLQKACKICFVKPISTQTAITFYLQLRIDFRLFLLVLYSKAYLYTVPNLHIISWSHSCTSFPSRNPESTHARILFRFLTHLDFVVCLRSKNESCRNRRNM